MELHITTIIFKKSYGSEWYHGICIQEKGIIGNDGQLHYSKYFEIKSDKNMNPNIVQFEYEDVFEVLYTAGLDFVL